MSHGKKNQGSHNSRASIFGQSQKLYINYIIHVSQTVQKLQNINKSDVLKKLNAIVLYMNIQYQF